MNSPLENCKLKCRFERVSKKNQLFVSFRGWSIIGEKLSTSDFVDLDSIIEKFIKLRPKRFTSDSKYEEIMLSLCMKVELNLLRPFLQELEDKNLQDKDILKFFVQFVQWDDLNSEIEIGVRKLEDVPVELEQSLGEL